jgi:hypothetical protein
MHQQLIIEKISGILEATDDTYDVKLTEMLDMPSGYLSQVLDVPSLSAIFLR